LVSSTLGEVFDCPHHVGSMAQVTELPDRVDVFTAGLDAVRRAVGGRRRPRVVTEAALAGRSPGARAGRAVGAEPLLAQPGERTAPITCAQLLEPVLGMILLLLCGFRPIGPARSLRPCRRVQSGRSCPRRVPVLGGPAYFHRPGPRVVRGIEVSRTFGMASKYTGECLRIRCRDDR
jgi:iron complex transport system substrate-binding protein